MESHQNNSSSNKIAEKGNLILKSTNDIESPFFKSHISKEISLEEINDEKELDIKNNDDNNNKDLHKNDINSFGTDKKNLF